MWLFFGQRCLYSGKRCCILAKLLYSRKIVVFGAKVVIVLQSGYIREKVVVFGQKWLYS